jgi:hypothetical protein
MKPISGTATDADADAAMDEAAAMEADFWRELAEIEAESLGWLPLQAGCYLHVGSAAPVVEVVGAATAAMAGSNVLWLV